MDMRQTLVTAALKVLEQEGEAQFSTRAVCALAKVTAPTLYHHFGNADGLLSAAMAEAFEQYLAGKKAAMESSDNPVSSLANGWDNYVRFAAERPRLYAAMMARILQGADIPAARQARAMLGEQIAAIEAAGRLALPAEAAAQIAMASANAAALLYATVALEPRPPDPAVVAALRDSTLRTICTP